MKKGVGLLLSSIIVVLIVANILLYIKNNDTVTSPPIIEETYTHTSESKLDISSREPVKNPSVSETKLETSDKKKEGFSKKSENAYTLVDSSDIEVSQESQQEYQDEVTEIPKETMKLPKEKYYTITPVSREEAKLSAWETLDLTHLNLNPRLAQLLDEAKNYRVPDFHLGIEYYEDTAIINGSFKQDLIGDVTIGNSFEELVNILGEPTVIYVSDNKNYYCYKTKRYYVIFYGENVIELAVLDKNYEGTYNYEAGILKPILKDAWEYRLNYSKRIFNNYGLLLDYSCHIHGGGTYFKSKAGVEVVLFHPSYLRVYNNYQGELFLFEDHEELSVEFRDEDINIEYLKLRLNQYIEADEKFKEAEISPDGSYAYYYVFEYSQSYYMLVRTLDGSRPDIRLGCYSNFKWTEDNMLISEDYDKTRTIGVDEYMATYDEENS